MFNDIFDQLHISPFQIKIFIGTFLAMFIMVSLHALGVHAPWKTPALTLPVSKDKPANDVENLLKPKLEKKATSFVLQKDTSIVEQAHADTEVIDATAYAVVDLETGKIVAEKNSSQQLPIASLTKIMTAVVALDLALPSDVFTVTKLASQYPPTKLGIVPGEKMTLEELLNGALLTSANDAAEEIREGIDEKYNKHVFIEAMNEKASFLGLKNSHFSNPQGFDNAENYSSAEDLAILTQYALAQYPLFANIVKKDYQFMPNDSNHKQFDLYNWNGLLGVYPGAQGVKIGNTAAAGTTTIVYATRGGKKLLAIVLGAHGVLQRDLSAAKLLDTGYEKTLGLAPINITEEQLRQKYGTWQYFN